MRRMWQASRGTTTAVQGGQAVAAPPGQPNPVPAVAVPGPISALNSNPLSAALRDIVSSIEAPLDTVGVNYQTTAAYTQALKNAALAYATEAVVTGTITVTLGASTTASYNGGGISLSPKFPFNLLDGVQFGINQIADVINASGWLMFQENLHMLHGIDVRQMRKEWPAAGGRQTPAAQYTLPYYVSATVAGNPITLTPGGAAYYNKTTATVNVVITFGFPLMLPFVNNFDEFLGIVPSAAQDVELNLQYKFRNPLGANADSPIQALSGADLTGTNAQLLASTGFTGSIAGTEFFLSSPPAGQEAAYAVQAGTICQRFEQRVTSLATGTSGAKYVAPQGAYLLRMIADLTLNYLQNTSDVDQIRIKMNEFANPLSINLSGYLARYYRKYGRLPDPGIFVWDGSYSSIVPNWGDSMDWIDASKTIKPTLEMDIASTATLGSNGAAYMNVLRTQLVTPGA